MELAEGHDEADGRADRINVVIPGAANQSLVIGPGIRRSPGNDLSPSPFSCWHTSIDILNNSTNKRWKIKSITIIILIIIQSVTNALFNTKTFKNRRYTEYRLKQIPLYTHICTHIYCIYKYVCTYIYTQYIYIYIYIYICICIYINT